jgi:hypothetical protein
VCSLVSFSLLDVGKRLCHEGVSMGVKVKFVPQVEFASADGNFDDSVPHIIGGDINDEAIGLVPVGGAEGVGKGQVRLGIGVVVLSLLLTEGEFGFGENDAFPEDYESVRVDADEWGKGRGYDRHIFSMLGVRDGSLNRRAFSRFFRTSGWYLRHIV